MALHISISAETVANVGPLPISNSMLTSMVVTVAIVLFCVSVSSTLRRTGKPSRLQSFAEMLIEGLYNLCYDITSSTPKARLFAPWVISFFLFIVLNNWAGLLPGVGTIGFREAEATEHVRIAPAKTLKAAAEPTEVDDSHPGDVQVGSEANQEGTEGVGPATESEGQESAESTTEEHAGTFVPYFRAGTADLNTTIALALISVALTQIFGIKMLGIPYFGKYINFSSPIMFFVGVLEFVLELAKIMSFAFRLFGNIFAGEVLLAVMMFLVPVVIPMPFYGLELFVGVIQALVFSMLSLVFFNLATIGHAEHGEEH